MCYLYLLATVLLCMHHGRSHEAFPGNKECFSSEWLKSVVMSMKITKTGFHRELQYNIHYDTPAHDVKALLIQKLPSGVYMDEYQLATLRQDRGLEVQLDSKVDLEAPEYLSQGFSALIYLSSSSSGKPFLEVTVPIHGRYHRPSNSSHVQVDIESPRLLLRSDQCRTPSPSLSHVVVDAPCTVSSTHMCSWLEIQELQEGGAVSLKIPVGDVALTFTVCGVTLLFTLVNCMFLLRTIWEYGNF